jgi:molecular chaperone DnaK (HSP70)
MEYFIKLIKKKYKKDVSKNAKSLQKLRREAERAKRALSSQHQVRSHAVLFFAARPWLKHLSHQAAGYAY